MCFYAEAFKLAHHRRNCGTKGWCAAAGSFILLFAERGGDTSAKGMQ
jgi:hypothetical protein